MGRTSAPRVRAASFVLFVAVLTLNLVAPIAPPARAQTGCTPVTEPIVPGQTILADLDPEDCVHDAQTSARYDRYLFTATAGTEYTAGMAAEWLDPKIVVKDPSGAVVATDDDGGIAENARVHFTAAASGTYSIEATSSGFGIGPYEVSLGEGPCPPVPAPIAPGQAVAGRLSDADCVSEVQPESYFDAFALTATSGAPYTIALTAPRDPEGYEFEIDPLLVVRDPSGAVFLTDENSGVDGTARVDFAAAESGVYTIEVTNALPFTGTYRLEVRSGPCPPPATPVALGQTVDGEITEVDCRSQAVDGSLFDTFSFTAAAGDQRRIVMTRVDMPDDEIGTNIDPYLVVRDPSGAVVAEDDNGAGGINASVLLTAATAGTYTIEATSAATGHYTVSLAGVMCPQPPTPIAPGQTLSGALEASDCFSQHEAGAYADVWSFMGAPGQQFTVTLTPGQPVAVRLILRNPSGAVVAQGYGQHGGSPSIVHTTTVTGTYTFEVTGADPGTTTPYSVSLAVAACPSAPISIPVNQTVSGALTTTDCLGGTRPNAYYDRYTFQALTGRTYTVRVLTNAFDPAIAGIGIGGYTIFCCEPVGQRTFRIQPPANGPLTVEVTSYTGIGAYTIIVEERVCTSSYLPIAVGQTISGALEATDCFSVYHTRAAAQHHQDTYTFDAVAGEAYHITLSSSAYFPYFRLTTPAGGVVVERGDDFTNTLEYTYTALVSGPHQIEVSSEYERWTGPYTLSLAPGVACTSGGGPLAPGQTVAGSLSATDCYNGTPWYLTGSHFDRYTVEMQAGVRYTINMDTTEVEPFVMLRDPAGAVVATGSDYSPGGSGFPDRHAEVLYTPQTSGLYTIDATSDVAEDTGAYTLALVSNSNCNGAATPISVGDVVAGALETTDCDSTIRPFSFRDHYTFTGTAGQRVKITMTSQPVDSFLGLFGPGGQLLATDDDGGVGADARIVITLPAAGTYTIEATSFWSNWTGAYSLRLEPGDGGGTCSATPTPIAVGDAVDGLLSGTECPAVSRPSSYHDGYTFSAQVGQTYVISMVTNSFDAYLAVLDSSNQILAVDDDGGYGLNALVEFTPSRTGVYKIEATSAEPDALGGYYLSLTLAQGPAPECTTPPVPLELGQTLPVELSTSDCRSEFQTSSHRDQYTIVVQAGQTYRLYMESTAVDPWLVLVDSFGNALLQGDDTDDGTANAEIVFTAPEDETFTVEATSANPDEVGPYTISFQTAAPPPSDDERANRTARGANGCAGRTLKIGPGRKIENSLATTDCLAPERASSYHNRYALRAVAGVDYTITMQSTEVDARLILVGPAGAIVAEDDNGGGKLDARVRFTPTADALYTIVATTTAPTQTGRYELAVEGRTEETVGVYLPQSGVWFLRNTNAAGAADAAFGYGPSGLGWTALSGDWDGDGIDTVGVYDPATGFFFLRNQNAGGGADAVFSFGPGGLGWVPLAGDWDGDGDDTVGVYAPSGGTFFLRNENAPGGADLLYSFGPGGAGFAPVVGDWNADGASTVGLYGASTGVFFLRDQHAGGPADRVFTYGPAGAVPVIGDWDGR